MLRHPRRLCCWPHGREVGQGVWGYQGERMKVFESLVAASFYLVISVAPFLGFTQHLPFEEDLGVDIVIVIKQKANLRQEPTLSSVVVIQLMEGERLVLIDRAPHGNWYNVFHVDSGLEGWIREDLIRILYTRERKNAPLFQPENLGTTEKPVIEIRNDSSRVLRLRMDGVLIPANSTVLTIPSNSRQTITIDPGRYKYYAGAAGVIPAFGEEDFYLGHRYTWTFWIKTSYGIGFRKSRRAGIRKPRYDQKGKPGERKGCATWM